MSEATERLKLMRRSTSAMHIRTVSATTESVIPYSEERVALVICPPGAGTLNLRLRQPGTSGTGLAIASAGGLVQSFNIWDHGDMVRGPWFGEVGGPTSFAYVESVLPEQMNL